MKKYKKVTIKEQENRVVSTGTPIAVYYRQSTEAQVGNVSTTLQTVDMVEKLKQRGWSVDKIILIDMDMGVSGSKRIDERPGMSYLFNLIQKGKIGAVACVDEDRLFRDVTQIQVNIFIDACKRNNVYVITPNVDYDFAHPLMGNFYISQFRRKSEMAADFFEGQYKKLYNARRFLAMSGKYYGTTITPGYMVDIRKNLPDGTPNPDYKKFVPFKSYAVIVKLYFELFLEQGCSYRRLHNHLIENNIGFPDSRTVEVPAGYKISTKAFKANHNGVYIPLRDNLADWFTNVMYIGHWVYNDQIVVYNNHEPIVPIDLFMRIFNRISPVNFDGTENKNYTGSTISKKRKEGRPEYTPLLQGILKYKGVNGKPYNAYMHYSSTDNRWDYGTSKDLAGDENHWHKSAEYIDDAISYLLFNKLQASFNEGEFNKALDEVTVDYSKDKEFKQQQIAEADKQISICLTQLDILTDPFLITRAQDRYKALNAEKQRLQNELLQLEASDELNASLAEIRGNYQQVLNAWWGMTNDEKLPIIQSFVKLIYAEIKDGKLWFTIHWFDNQQDVIEIYNHNLWSFADLYILDWLGGNATSQLEICEAFPDISWERLYHQIRRLGYSAVFRPKPVRNYECYNDYLKRVEEKGEELITKVQWTNDELQQLQEMLNKGCDKLDLVIAFPTRKWTHIRSKISKFRGKDFEVAGELVIGYQNSLMSYLAENDLSLSQFLIQYNKSVKEQNRITELPIPTFKPFNLVQLCLNNLAA